MSVFALRDINMKKLESRPLRSSPILHELDNGRRSYNYVFFIDFIGSTAEVRRSLLFPLGIIASTFCMSSTAGGVLASMCSSPTPSAPPPRCAAALAPPLGERLLSVRQPASALISLYASGLVPMLCSSALLDAASWACCCSSCNW